MLATCVLCYFLSKMYHKSMFIAAIGIPMLIHLVQYGIGWWEGVVYERKLVTRTSRSTPDRNCICPINQWNRAIVFFPLHG